MDKTKQNLLSIIESKGGACNGECFYCSCRRFFDKCLICNNEISWGKSICNEQIYEAAYKVFIELYSEEVLMEELL